MPEGAAAAPPFMGCARRRAFVGSFPRSGQRSGVDMRVSKVCWGVCALILASGTAQADGGNPPFGALDDSPRFMLYVQKQIGGTRHKSLGPSFGFAVDRSMETSTRI